MIKTSLIRIYHAYSSTREVFQWFLEGLSKILEHEEFTLWLTYKKWEFTYSFSGNEHVTEMFESKLYTEFQDFQMTTDTVWIWDYDPTKSVVGDISLKNNWFFPFSHHESEESDFVTKLFRSFDWLNLSTDTVGFFIALEPFEPKWVGFFLSTKFSVLFFRIRLLFTFWKYIFDHKAEKWWKSKWFHFYEEKLQEEIFHTRIFLVVESSDQKKAKRIVESIFHNFTLFKNLPLNEFELHTHPMNESMRALQHGKKVTSLVLSAEEISHIFHFPNNPAKETALLKINARKLALPIGMPILPYTTVASDIVIAPHDPSLGVLGESDYRSVRVPLGIYDEDRLRHMYVVGKTGVGKSKFLVSMMIDDIAYGKWLAVIDPHGDLIEEVMMHIPENRKKDVVIFDPTDEQFPFAFNPLHIHSNESKQILAKGFIDIFKKFFGANWNPKLEHVLRMLFLGLLDVPGATMFDLIRALTDKDFRYIMIEHVKDDVVRNFWTNEFAGWSQQFNSEAIMPILNKVGQLLSIDMVKNIFTSTENKLDLRDIMDSQKILLIKLPKWRLQEEIMGFLWAMLVTKIYQTAMGRQSVDKNSRTPFFLYIDEFQNFATDTFSEILSEARKYGLGLIVAHQFIQQIPAHLSQALFGNVGSLVSFRISSDDARIMKEHFDPYVTAYDLANLSARDAYIKTLVKWQVRDPLSMRTRYVADVKVEVNHMRSLYQISRRLYARSLEVVKQSVTKEQREVLTKIETFGEPIL